MKKFFKENLFWLILATISIGIIVVTALIPNTRNILLIPFYIVGAITILRGMGGIINDLEKHIKHTWQVALIFLILAFGIVSLTNIFLH